MTGNESDEASMNRVSAMREAAAEQFDRDLDPLAKFASGMEANGIDPFYMFETEILTNQNISERTRKQYDVSFRQWKKWMNEQSRHPSCPSEEHVSRFIREYLRRVRDNSDDSIRAKLNHLNRAYRYMQNDDGLPHPMDFNPFEAAREKVCLTKNDKDPVPRISVEELRDVLRNITHVGYRAIVGVQLKLGVRRSELCNIRLSEVNLAHDRVRDHFEEIGSHPMVADRPNSVYIPPNSEREGNKSIRPRVLPLDDEVRQALIQYLLIRPSVDEGWLFLAKRSYGKLRNRSVNSAWKSAFDDYETGERYRDITSHFARHYFSNYWETELAARGNPLKYIMYMRGDKIRADEYEDHGIDHYLAGYYEDIKPVYLDGIYRLGLSTRYK